ncbi:zinc finger, CCHC-type containing protein [Tanacetum coccineum]
MAAAAMKHMASNFAKLDKFEGVDFRRWQKKIHFLLSSMSVVYVLTTLIPEDGGDDATVEQIRKRAKWDHDDYVCRGLILNEAKYMVEDASSKKFLISNFINYKMTDSRPVLEQYNELLGILGRFTQHKMNMDEAIQDSDKPKGNNVTGPSVVNMVEHNNSSMYNNNKGKRKHHDNTRDDPNKNAKPTCWKCGKSGHIKRDCKGVNVGNKANGSGTKASVDGSSNSLKGENMFNKSLRVYYITYVSEVYFVQDDDVAWWVDSGATVYYGRTYNRPVERSGDGKPSVGSNSQSVSINENIFQSFNFYAKAVLGKQISGHVGHKESLHRVIESFRVSYRNRTYRIIATEFAYWAPNIESMEVNSESNPLERKDAEGPSLDESLENEEHLDVDSCDSDSPKNVNNDSVSPSSRVLREEDVRGVESDLVDSFEEGEIRDDSVLYNDGCIKDCMEKNLEDDAGEILGVHSQGDCGNVTTDDNEDVTPVIAPEKDSIIAPPSTPPGNDLNIAVESGSSWIDYIGPLTSDEIDSDKRWSYRDPNGNIHGLFSLAQLRSWKDYFPSDLQIWSYYGNVKEAILLHNALSRQTKDAG